MADDVHVQPLVEPWPAGTFPPHVPDQPLDDDQVREDLARLIRRRRERRAARSTP